ncbi:MAG: integrase arm-type DNA-binding domain-containing protein [Yoonia sp.]
MGKLTARSVTALKEPGMHGDGEGLYLNVKTSGAKSWILRVRVAGETKRREIGLGALSLLPLAEARRKSTLLRAEAKAGRNPMAKRDRRRMTFEDAARAYFEKLSPTFKNATHKANWLATLENHAFPKIGQNEIKAIRRADVLEVLSPIWTERHETARRVKQRMAAVFDWSIAAGHMDGANPVDAALQKSLPKVRVKVAHHAAVAWRDMPGFMNDLRDREAIAARCLEFIALTAARSGEARGATWAEIDLERAVWEIPAARMKAGDAHRVPLSDAAVSILQSVQGLDDALVFPSPSSAKDGTARELSVNAFRPLFERMKRVGTTAHGLRSTFRDWAAESAKADRTVAEAALAHKVQGVEAAYFRSDLFDRRRDLMDAWGRYCSGAAGDIVELVRA